PAGRAALRRALAGPVVASHRPDVFQGALALAPPKPRRGLVLVDQSYEVKAHYAAAVAFARGLVARWPEAVLLIWYPLLAAGRHRALRDGLAPLPHRIDEVAFAGASAGMTGSGLALVNPPHGAKRAFAVAHAAAAPV